MRVIDRDEVARRLTYELCIPIVRQAMIDFSRGETRQLLRSIIPLAHGHMFGIMPGALGEHAAFGAKLISVYPENFSKGRQSHQGLVVLFDPETGEPVCVVHAGEITAIRTAAASAVATGASGNPRPRPAQGACHSIGPGLGTVRTAGRSLQRAREPGAGHPICQRYPRGRSGERRRHHFTNL